MTALAAMKLLARARNPAAVTHDVFDTCDQCRDEITDLRAVNEQLLAENTALRRRNDVLKNRDPDDSDDWRDEE